MKHVQKPNIIQDLEFSFVCVDTREGKVYYCHKRYVHTVSQ